jgi:hypothetical protein
VKSEEDLEVTSQDEGRGMRGGSRAEPLESSVTPLSSYSSLFTKH